MKKQERSRKQQHIDIKSHHDSMSLNRPDTKARERFKRPAYQARSMIRKQGKQMEQYDVIGYMDKKGHDVKGEMQVGQENS